MDVADLFREILPRDRDVTALRSFFSSFVLLYFMLLFLVGRFQSSVFLF
jgi:hypothetical protein